MILLVKVNIIFLNLILKKLPKLLIKKFLILIESQYQRAIKILEDNKDKLIQLADILIEKEVIFKDDLEKIFGKRPFDKVEVLCRTNRL